MGRADKNWRLGNLENWRPGNLVDVLHGNPPEFEDL
jgi:hypothetical protein